MASLAIQLELWVTDLEDAIREVGSATADDVAEDARYQLEHFGPSPDWSENIYAEGPMQADWHVEEDPGGDPFKRLVVSDPINEQGEHYGGYADLGYTIHGPGTAQPRIERQVHPLSYTAVIAVNFAQPWQDRMQRRLDALRHGSF